ncbi:hypothetical protein Mapa_004918 [Marchantia paleacea]|nr:hypothetical protein Mapa_004918 [Marchantia paleacea]
MAAAGAGPAGDQGSGQSTGTSPPALLLLGQNGVVVVGDGVVLVVVVVVVMVVMLLRSTHAVALTTIAMGNRWPVSSCSTAAERLPPCAILQLQICRSVGRESCVLLRSRGRRSMPVADGHGTGNVSSSTVIDHRVALCGSWVSLLLSSPRVSCSRCSSKVS